MDDFSYGALAVALALVGGLYTYLAYRRRGIGAGLRGAGLTALPIAAYLTRVLQLAGNLVGDVGDWATGLVFRPSVWAGVALAGVAVVLFGAGTAVLKRSDGRPEAVDGPRRREVGASTTTPGTSVRDGAGAKPAKPAKPAKGKGGAKPTGDPELDEIEALLRDRGIN